MLWLKPPDGDWQAVDDPPDGAMHLTTTSRGIVAVGQCLAPGRDSELWDPDSDASGITWLSDDGLTWLPVEQSDPYRHVMQLVFERETDLVGMGFDARRYYRRQPDGAVWVSPLPAADPTNWVGAPPGYVDETCGTY
jgi:hypothetical protein